MEKPQSTIILQLSCSKYEAERYRKILVLLISKGALDIPNGNSVLHFNNNQLKGIDLNIKRWHSDKCSEDLTNNISML
jgi:hypothetical protein